MGGESVTTLPPWPPVPLNNLVIPDNPGHIGDKVEDPSEQHLQFRPTGISNFLRERIPFKSQLYAVKWKKITEKLLGSAINTFD